MFWGSRTRYTNDMQFELASAPPSWMRFIQGDAPIVFVAPHGGRRPAEAPIKDSIKVNDLYTAELTEELAARTRGYALINQALDRNDLDLNRISQVRARAAWFLDALVELVSSLVDHHGEVRVFFIHGWNVVQPVCDLGMGLKQRGQHVAPASKFAAPTLSATFFNAVVLPFRSAALALGLDVAIGRRYPAADKENVMQLFSTRFARDPSPLLQRLAEWSAQEQVHALQLELGVGLRWPGEERERFVEVFCHTLGACAPLPSSNGDGFAALPAAPVETAPVVHDTGSLFPLHASPKPTRFGLHFHDPLSGFGIMGGIEFGGEEPTHSGRLMLSLGGTEMALFTGEDAAGHGGHRVQVGGLTWRSEPDGFSISYRGPVMRFSHPQAFIRLEEGLAASRVEPAEAQLRLTIPWRTAPQWTEAPLLPLFLAHLHGEVRLRDQARRIDAWGFLDMLKPDETGRLMPRKLVSLPFGPDLGVFLSWVETVNGPRSAGVVYHHGVPHQLQPEEWDLLYTVEDGRPTAFQVSINSLSSIALQCRGEPVTAIPIVRHAPHGSALNVTFGLSRVSWQGREARGVYEFSERRRG
jgi:hypothetical protein